NAIVASARVQDADASYIDDGSTLIDRGAGLPDAWLAHQLLNGSGPGNPVIPGFSPLVRDNVAPYLPVVSSFPRTVGPLKPGQRADVLFEIPSTGTVRIDVNQIAESPGAPQNEVFGDGISVDIHSAKTSAIRAAGDYLGTALP